MAVKLAVVMVAVLGLTTAMPTPTFYPNNTLRWRGVNLSGAEFSSLYFANLAATVNDASTFALAGANVVRYPMSWDGAQNKTLAGLTPAYMATVVPQVEGLLEAGFSVLLDLHAYMRHGGVVVNAAELADMWTRLLSPPAAPVNVTFGDAARRFGGDGLEQGPQLILDLMNEPHDMPSADMLANYNAALKAIRGLGLKNLAFVEGNQYSGLHSWTQSLNGQPANADVIKPGSVVDPANHWVVNVHQYLDSNSAGKSPDCITDGEFEDKIKFAAFAEWLASVNMRAFLSEFGAAYNANCISQEGHLLELVANHSIGSMWASGSLTTGFLGFTAWAAGHAWSDKYFMGLNPGDQAQASIVAVFIDGGFWTPPPGACDAPGYLLSFNSTPPGVASGFSLQLHNPDWSSKQTLTKSNGGPPPLVCVPASAVAAGEDQVALYDQTGKQFVCPQPVNATNAVLHLETCHAS